MSRAFLLAGGAVAALTGLPHHNHGSGHPRPAHVIAAPLSRLQAAEREFSITLSRQAVASGRVAIEGVNAGEDPHDLRLRSADGHVQDLAALAPGARSTARLDLAPGTYVLFCGLPGHEGLGMRAPLTVR